jgi:hypothetical protein
MEYQRLALILDDEAGQIGELALRLVRLGVRVLYANDFDETVLLAHQAADDVGSVIVPSNRALEWLPLILKRLHLPPAAVVPVGERPDDASVESLHREGIRWALWNQEDERALRFVVTAAISETDASETRFELRVPTKLEGTVHRGSLDRRSVILNLNETGALVALDPPVPAGGRIKLRLGIGDEALSLGGRVVWSTEDPEVQTVEAGPVMGVRFEDVDLEDRAALMRFLAKELERFRL